MKTQSLLFDPPDADRLTVAQLRVRDAFNERIRSESLLNDVACLCGSIDLERLSEMDRHRILQPLAICRTCGLIQLNPRMSQTEYEEFYSSDHYRLLYDGEHFVANHSAKLIPEHGQRILWAILKAAPETRSVVEIGAGGGWNLVAFKQAGLEICGYDYSEQLVALGVSHGVPMRRGGLKEALAAGQQYDAIILNHVLEHLLDPVADLRALHGLQSPGGCLYVGVPATDYPAMGLLQNAHTYYFTDRTLSHYLAVAGWECGPILHEDRFAMHTVARATNPKPVSLATEYADSLSRLRARRWQARIFERWYSARTAFCNVLDALGLYTAVRTAYRRLRG